MFRLIAILCLTGSFIASANSEVFATSFESDSISGWTFVGTGAADKKLDHTRDVAHSGVYSESIESGKRVGCVAPLQVTLEKGDACIASAWIKASTGRVWLEVRIVDAGNRTVKKFKSAPVEHAADWTYAAMETREVSASTKAGPLKAELSIWVERGKVEIDDVTLHLLSPTFMLNGDFELALDKKGRIPFWSVEEEKTVAPGNRDGAVTLSDADAYSQKTALDIAVAGEWSGAASINYPATTWSDRFEFIAMARCEPNTEAATALIWTDDAGKVLRIDRGEFVSGEEWAKACTGARQKPEGATLVRPVMIARKTAGAGTTPHVRFDNAEFKTRHSSKGMIRVLGNQVGFETKGVKKFVVLTNYLPKKGMIGSVELLDENEKRVWNGTLTCVGRMYGQNHADWGWYFWQADASEFRILGRYTAKATVGDESATSNAIEIGDDVLFSKTAPINVDFFNIQRCGCAVPGWHEACHMDDAKLKSGVHEDLTGGWHSAGDYNKIMWEYGDGGAMYALIRAFEAQRTLFEKQDRNGDRVPDIVDEAWWGAKFLAKAQRPESGGFINHIEQGPDRKTWMNWCPPEKTTDNTVGTADDPIVTEGEGHSPLAIGGWARLARLLDSYGVTNNYLDCAKRLWAYATANGTGSADPLLLIGSLDLFDETHDATVLEYCRRSVSAMLDAADSAGRLTGGYGNSGDIPAAALAHFALKFPDDALTPRIVERLKSHTPLFIDDARNPLGLMMQMSGPDGYFFEPTSTLGCNYQIACRAWAALKMYQVTKDPRLMDYATSQLDFILGKNTYGLCMMEGVGSVNPPRYHHRYITIPGHERGAVPGAIPNGFVRDIGSFDRPGFDMSTAGRLYPSYRTSEPWLVHNVFYTLAVTALHEAVS